METVPAQRIVLAIARTLTSAVRLFEILELFRSDPRIQVVFVIDDGTRFADGVKEYLAAQGAKVVSWTQIAQLDIDLLLTASENADFGPVSAPILVLPHGIGFHKYLRDPNGEQRLSGMVPDRLLADERVHLLLSDQDQWHQLAAHHPGAADRAIVAGDPIHERTLASRRLRDHYRHSLGVCSQRRLILISSTWGGESLLGRFHKLPSRLLAELPADEYAVAAVVHPNVWHGHGPWQLRAWLADATDAGLILIPATHGWQAALVAADVVIGDHGSVTLYAAENGTPVIIACDGGPELVPGTQMADLVQRAPRLQWDAALLRQVDAVCDPRPPSLPTKDHNRTPPGNGANAQVRQALYRLLEVSEPTAPAPVRAWTLPRLDLTPVTAYAVYAQPGSVLWRHPVSVDDALAPRSQEVSRHVAAYEDELDGGRWESAAVVLKRSPGDAENWIRRHSQRHRIAAAPVAGGWLAAIRNGPTVKLSASDQPGGTGDGSPVEPMWLTGVLYDLLCRQKIDNATVSLTVGGQRLIVSIQLV